MLKKICTVSIVGLVVGLCTPAVAQQQTNAQPAQRQTIADPNAVVCQKQEVTGSRLVSKKVCKTRAEWADGQLQDKQEVSRVQTQRGNAGQFP
jgi:hypothetical protein